MSFSENFRRLSLVEKILSIVFIAIPGVVMLLPIGKMILDIFENDLLKVLSVISAVIGVFSFIIGIFFGVTFTDLHAVLKENKDVKFMLIRVIFSFIFVVAVTMYEKHNRFFLFFNIVFTIFWGLFFIFSLYVLISEAKKRAG